jgi:hypothetical protein
MASKDQVRPPVRGKSEDRPASRALAKADRPRSPKQASNKPNMTAEPRGAQSQLHGATAATRSIRPRSGSGANNGILLALLLGAILGCLFLSSFKPGTVLFSNDGPYGGLAALQNLLPGVFFGSWNDLNWLGERTPPVSLGPSAGVRMGCWFLTPPILIVWMLCAILGYCYYRRGLLLRLTGCICFASAGAMALAMVLHTAGTSLNLDWLIPFGSFVWLTSLIIVFSLRPDL